METLVPTGSKTIVKNSRSSGPEKGENAVQKKTWKI